VSPGWPPFSLGCRAVPRGAGKITVPGKVSVAGPGSWGFGARPHMQQRGGPVSQCAGRGGAPCHRVFLSTCISVFFCCFELRHSRARCHLHCPGCVFTAFLAQQTGCMQVCKPGWGVGAGAAASASSTVHGSHPPSLLLPFKAGLNSVSPRKNQNI